MSEKERETGRGGGAAGVDADAVAGISSRFRKLLFVLFIVYSDLSTVRTVT